MLLFSFSTENVVYVRLTKRASDKDDQKVDKPVVKLSETVNPG